MTAKLPQVTRVLTQVGVYQFLGPSSHEYEYNDEQMDLHKYLPH